MDTTTDIMLLEVDEEGKPLSTQYIRYTCTADKKYIEENRDLICNKDFSEDVLYNDMISPACKECKYLKKEKIDE